MGAAGFRAAALALACAACTSIAVDARTFEGTRWRVTAINGQATPMTGDYNLRFENGQVGARFGCNHFRGRYEVSGEVVVARDIASTLMGCPEPAATFESQGLKVLQQPMRSKFASGQKVTLSNAAGSIALERLR